MDKRETREVAGPKGKAIEERHEFSTTISKYFFLVLVLWILYLSYQLIRPFLINIFLAFVLYVVGENINKSLRKLLGGRKRIAASLTTLILVTLFVVPLIILIQIIASQAFDLYQYATQKSPEEWLRFLGQLKKYIPPAIERFFDAKIFKDIDIGKSASQLLQIVSKLMYTQVSYWAKKFYSLFMSLFLLGFISYYLFADGEKLLKKIRQLSPLSERLDQIILENLIDTIKATMRGAMLIALIQGFLGGMGFLIFGIDTWAFWGAIMVMASFIPVVGTALIWGPGVIYLIIIKHYGSAIGLFLWGAILIGGVDNFVRPYVIRGKRTLHPLLIFFSVMGGLSLFGIFGLLIGPVIISLLMGLLDVYLEYFKTTDGYVKEIEGRRQ